MSWRHRLGHALMGMAVAPAAHRFERELDRIEWAQRRKLARLLEQQARIQGVEMSLTAEQFQRRSPVTRYDDWRHRIEQWRNNGQGLTNSPLIRFQPTSGSTSAIKWVPYTAAFLQELDAAIGPWLADLYRQFPRLKAGSHYWSLSWLPDDMREQQGGQLNDDSQLLSMGKRILAALTQSVPDEIALAPTSDDASFATLAYLAADDQLAMLSVWSPTFALTQQDQLYRWRDELAKVLSSGSWGKREGALGFLRCPQNLSQAKKLQQWRGESPADFFRSFWPNMAVVSAWDTAAAKGWAQLLHRRLAHSGFQGKGLWATEGVVTFPYRGAHTLAYQSHFYEFENLDDGNMLFSWQLREGMTVAPVITTGSGLLRYRMGDCLQVGESLGQVPTLQFLGREDGVDLVGEKLSTVAAQQLLDDIVKRHKVQPVSLAAMDRLPDGGRGYVLMLEGELNSSLTLAKIAADAEALLQQHFHYRLARSLRQLQPLAICQKPGMREVYLDACRRRGMIEGNIKIEPLRLFEGDVALPELTRGRSAVADVLA